MVEPFFVWDERLGILVPMLEGQWGQLSQQEQSHVLHRWEEIRGAIPDRIKSIEHVVIEKQEALFEEEDFEQSCKLNQEIADLASTIHDLNLWSRTQQELDAKSHQ